MVAVPNLYHIQPQVNILGCRLYAPVVDVVIKYATIISIAAFYAHLAAQRGVALLKGGCNPSDLPVFSSRWIKDQAGMYFL